MNIYIISLAGANTRAHASAYTSTYTKDAKKENESKFDEIYIRIAEMMGKKRLNHLKILMKIHHH